MNTLTFQDVYQTSTSAIFKKGQRASTPDGREWVYVKAGAVLASGSVAVPAAVTTVASVSSSTDNLGRIVYITKAGATWTAGQFEDAVGVVNAGTGVGQSFKVKTNTATTLELYPETALSTALAVATSGVAVRTMSDVTKAAITVTTQSTVGVAQTAFATGEYGWLLTGGDGVVLAGEVLVIGSGFTTGGATTGEAIKAITATGPFDAQNLGICLVANAAADQAALCRVAIR